MQWFLVQSHYFNVNHIIDGAQERYKQFNKAVLESSPLSDEVKRAISTQIDLNAEEQKNIWISIFQQKGITIIK